MDSLGLAILEQELAADAAVIAEAARLAAERVADEHAGHSVRQVQAALSLPKSSSSARGRMDRLGGWRPPPCLAATALR